MKRREKRKKKEKANVDFGRKSREKFVENKKSYWKGLERERKGNNGYERKKRCRRLLLINQIMLY